MAGRSSALPSAGATGRAARSCWVLNRFGGLARLWREPARSKLVARGEWGRFIFNCRRTLGAGRKYAGSRAIEYRFLVEAERDQGSRADPGVRPTSQA